MKTGETTESDSKTNESLNRPSDIKTSVDAKSVDKKDQNVRKVNDLSKIFEGSGNRTRKVPHYIRIL